MAIATQQEDIRARLVEAAYSVMRRSGLAGCTTKEIARAAGVAEGSIYNHFADKFDLCLEAVGERFPRLEQWLPSEVGKRPPRRVLSDVVQSYLEALQETIPVFSGVLGHPELARKLRARQTTASIEAVSAYLAAEQRAGTLGCGGDPSMLARVLLGTTFHAAYMHLLRGEAVEKGFVQGVVNVVLAAAGGQRGSSSANAPRSPMVGERRK